MVPPEQSADLRAYYAKHTKSDRLDSRILARLPLLHPEGLHTTEDLGPGEPPAADGQARFEPGQATHQRLVQAGRAAGDSRSGLACRCLRVAAARSTTTVIHDAWRTMASQALRRGHRRTSRARENRVWRREVTSEL
ncbi:hypothetical protein GCM10027569_34340 [Flindersiella endophytica]